MAWLVDNAWLVIVVLSALGAAVTSAVVVAFGFSPSRRDRDELDDEEVPGDETRALVVTKLGHAIATVCFALIVVLAVLAQLKPGALRDERAEIARLRAEVERLAGRLRDTVASVDEKLAIAASPPTSDKSQAKSTATAARGEPDTNAPGQSAAQAPAPGGSGTSQAMPAERPSRARPAPPEQARRDDATTGSGLPVAPPRTRPLSPSRSSTPSSGARALSEPRPAPSMTATAVPDGSPPQGPPASRTAPVTGGPSRLVTTVGDVRIEVDRDHEGGGDSRVTSYTAKLSDLAGRPLVASGVALVGRMSDGSQAEASLDPTSTPGVYSARVASRPDGPHGLVLQVKLEARRLAVPLE